MINSLIFVSLGWCRLSGAMKWRAPADRPGKRVCQRIVATFSYHIQTLLPDLPLWITHRTTAHNATFEMGDMRLYVLLFISFRNWKIKSMIDVWNTMSSALPIPIQMYSWSSPVSFEHFAFGRGARFAGLPACAATLTNLWFMLPFIHGHATPDIQVCAIHNTAQTHRHHAEQECCTE